MKTRYMIVGLLAAALGGAKHYPAGSALPTPMWSMRPNH